MSYKILNLRTGEMLNDAFETKASAEYYINYFISSQYEAYCKIMEQCQYLSQYNGNLYYIVKGIAHEKPQDKVHYFEIIEI